MGETESTIVRNILNGMSLEDLKVLKKFFSQITTDCFKERKSLFDLQKTQQPYILLKALRGLDDQILQILARYSPLVDLITQNLEIMEEEG
jgi:hypothetical protein